MSLFFGRRENRDLGYFATDTLMPGVSAEKAMTLTPVYAAHRHIIDYLSTLPIDTFRKEGEKRVPAPTPALLSIPDGPGAEGLVSWLGKAAHGLANGNAVGYVRAASGYGLPTDVQWLHWSQWRYVEETGQWYVNGRPVPASLIVHIPGGVVIPGRRLALSPIELFAGVVTAGLSAQEYADIKRGGGIPPAILKNQMQVLDPAAAASVQSKAVKSFATGKPFVTGKDWDLTLLSIPPNHAQFIETLKLTANQVAAIYGIDPTEIGGEAANSLTYSTEELRQINRAANMRPYIERLERGLSRLLPERQIVKLNIDATMRVDLKTRVEVTGAQILDGRMSVNEARTLDDREPVAGGDFHNVPAPKAEPNTRKVENHD